MPGLLGVASTRGPQEAVRRFAIVQERMLRHRRTAMEPFAQLAGAIRIGRVRLLGANEEPDGTRPKTDAAAARPIGAFHGVLYNEADLRKQLRPSGPVETLDDLIVELYVARGPGFAADLEGEFCLAIADPSRGETILASDPIGNHPVYWRVDPDGFIFSSDLSALLKATPQGRRLNLRAVADYLTIGAVYGDKTLAEGVQLLDPGTVLIYNSRGCTTLRRYVAVEHFFGEKATDRATYFDRVQTAFTTAVSRAASHGGPLGLSLSGGLDSRTILATMNGRSATLRTYTLGVDGCADQVIAKRLTTLAGTAEHFYFRLDNTYLRDFLPNMAEMVGITDGMYLSHGLTEMLALQFLEKTGIAVLLRGHGGELAKAHLAWPLHTDAHIYTLTSIKDLVPYLSRRANYITPNLPLSDVFTPEAAALAGSGSAASFAAALEGTSLSAADACSYLYLRELHRRFTVASLELFRTRVDVRLPYVDPEYLRVLLAAPSPWRDTTGIHRRLTGHGMPALLKVRNSNTGARADAGPLAELLLDKVNTALKRLHVWGYRHYHDFDGWMRRMLLESVQSELLSPSSHVRRFLKPGMLEDLIRATRDGTADRSYLLQVLLILELWQRQNGIEDAA